MVPFFDGDGDLDGFFVLAQGDLRFTHPNLHVAVIVIEAADTGDIHLQEVRLQPARFGEPPKPPLLFSLYNAPELSRPEGFVPYETYLGEIALHPFDDLKVHDCPVSLLQIDAVIYLTAEVALRGIQLVDLLDAGAYLIHVQDFVPFDRDDLLDLLLVQFEVT